LNGQRRYKYLVLGRDKSYFVNKNKKTLILPKRSRKRCNQNAIFVLRTHVMLGGHVFNRQSYIRCVPSSRGYITLFIWRRIHGETFHENDKKLAYYIDDAVSPNNVIFSDYIDHIYPIGLDIKDIYIINWQWWPDNNEMYDKRDDFNMLLLWTFHFYVATFQQHLHMEYISLSWYDIPELLSGIPL
jgi:hypothetical protein